MKRLLPLLMLLVLLPACNRGGRPQPVDGPPSRPGWEVRYNATLALAHRGSDRIQDERVWEILLEMLDEKQQLRNFRRKMKDGTEVSDEGPAYLTVVSALHAVQELHRQRPDIDLAGLADRIEALTKSDNPVVALEAKRVQQTLAQK